jgi:hypothetical protein
MLKRLLLVITGFIATPALGQEKPTDSDSPAYKQAYELIFDSQARAKKAEQILLDNGKKKLSDLNVKELSLVCRVYNEMFVPERQLAVAKELWDRFPDSSEATKWMVNSMENCMMEDGGVSKTIDFVDTALKENKGIRSQLLLLKARATLQKRKGISDAEKRVLVSDLLIEAYTVHDKSKEADDFLVLSNVNFLDFDPSFSQYFSTVEREALKVRMQRAKTTKD